MGTLRIISYSGEPFRDRQEAGQLLGMQLKDCCGQGPIVLGIPRGGVVVADALAQALAAELDIVLSRKLRTPGHEELAMGSVTEDGKVFLNDELIREVGISRAEIDRERAVQMAEIARRAQLIRQVRPRVTLKDRVVIVTDDGVATGATFQAALWSARQEHPQRLIAAIPVGAPEAVKRLARDADELICLRVPSFFAAVGQFYRQFAQVADEEVLAILKEAQKKKDEQMTTSGKHSP